jgi:hypothetical protein
VLAPTRLRLCRGLREAGRRARAIDEVELKFDGHHGFESQRLETAQDAFEHVPGVAVEWRPVVLVHRDLHLRNLFAEPRRRHERSRDRQADPVGIALVEAESGRLHRAAQHVEREHGAGQQQPGTVHSLEFRHRDALAARDAHQVRKQQVDCADLRVAGQPGPRLLEVRGVRHDDPSRLALFRI